MHPTNDPSQHRPVSSPRAEADASKTGTSPASLPGVDPAKPGNQ